MNVAHSDTHWLTPRSDASTSRSVRLSFLLPCGRQETHRCANIDCSTKHTLFGSSTCRPLQGGKLRCTLPSLLWSLTLCRILTFDCVWWVCRVCGGTGACPCDRGNNSFRTSASICFRDFNHRVQYETTAVNTVLPSEASGRSGRSAGRADKQKKSQPSACEQEVTDDTTVKRANLTEPLWWGR